MKDASRTGNRVVVRPVGGLGNQLFIYAAGLDLARRNGAELVVDNSWFSTQEKRAYELDSFASSAAQEVGSWRPSAQDRFPRTARYLDKVLGKRVQIPGTFGEANFSHNASIVGLKLPVSLSGYFQSYKYFQESESVLRSEMRSILNPTEWFSATNDKLNSLGGWIGVHIRRGDYLEPGIKEFHGVLGATYYDRALRIARDLVGNLPIVVFSDDPNGTKSLQVDLQSDVHAISAPDYSRPIETLNIMASSRAMITANSSFSWWGAWLGEQPNRPVICPRPWFATKTIDYRDLLLPQWISIGRE